MSNFTVTSTADTPGDTGQGTNGAGTLRQAINYLKATGGGTISFDPALGTSPTFTSTTPIDMPYVQGVTYSFYVDEGRAVTIADALTGSNMRALKTGAGVLILSGADTQAISVVAGVVQVDPPRSVSSIDVMSGGALRGAGSVGYLSVAADGVFAPGSASGVGVLTTDNVSLMGTFVETISSTTDFGQVIQLSAAGYRNNVGPVIGGVLSLTDTAPVAIGAVFKIIDNRTSLAVSGTFSNAAQGAVLTTGGHALRVSYIGGDGNDVTLTEIAPGTGLAIHDVNKDARADLVWRGSDGSLRIWDMDGASIISNGGVRTIDNSWKIVGLGDRGGTGNTALIWESTSGEVRVWDLSQYRQGNQTAYEVRDIRLALGIPAEYTVQKVADFTGDGKADLLWRSSASGEVRLWTLSGDRVATDQTVATIPADWKIAGVGDFNGDGKADLLWRNDDGHTRLWLMNGAAVALDTPLGGGDGTVATNWKVAGVGDVNGDGKADIVWQSTQGEVRLWLMNGASVSADIHLADILGNWTVQDSADFNGDGYADLMWRETSGEVRLWTMSPSGITTDQRVALVGSEWQIVNTHAG